MDLKDLKIAVIGLGYVGLPLAVEFGKTIKTYGFDINEKRIKELQKNNDKTLEVTSAELEITDIMSQYLARGELKVELMGRGTAWLDTGTHDDLLAAAQFIATIDKRQGLKVNAPEEVAYRNGWITAEKLREIAEPLRKSGYGEYLLKLLKLYNPTLLPELKVLFFLSVIIRVIIVHVSLKQITKYPL